MSKFEIFVLVVTIIFGAVIGFNYFVVNNEDNYLALRTWYLGENTQVSDVDLENDSDTKYTFVVNYYANEDNAEDSVELLEVKLTSYTDYEKTAVYSYGIQFINPTENLKFDSELGKKDVKSISLVNRYYDTYFKCPSDKVFYLNSVDGVSYDSTVDGKIDNKDNAYLIDFDGVTYAFKFNQISKISSYHILWVKHVKYNRSNFADFLQNIIDPIKSISPEGVYVDIPFKLDTFLTFYEYNETTGKFDNQTNKFADDTSFIKFKIYTHKRGATMLNDSLFNRVGENTDKGVIYG